MQEGAGKRGITMFYREAYPDTPIAYIKISDLVESVSGIFDTVE